MLSSLPPELLYLIIESAIPHTFHSTTYQDRQQTLCTLSLVSKCFRSIAQPLLLEIVWIKTAQDVDLLPTPSFGSQDGTKRQQSKGCWMVIGSTNISLDAPAEAKLMEKVAKSSISLEALTWMQQDQDILDISLLGSVDHLKSLQLINDLSVIWNPSALSNLHSLTLYHVGAKAAQALLDPAIVPNLRHFAFVDASFSNGTSLLKQTRLINLLPQIDTLSFDITYWIDSEMTFLAPFASRTLVDCSLRDLDNTNGMLDGNIVNLRFYDAYLDEHNGGFRFANLDLFASSLQQISSLSVRTLYLDNSLRPSSSLPPDLAKGMDKLTTVCGERGVELIFDAVPHDLSIDPFISGEFVRRQKAIKGG